MRPPLVGSEVDLRDFAYMPLDVVRLRDSDLTAVSTGEGFRAAVLLWCAAWHQVPASSLPNDDRVLGRLAGCGRDCASWTAIKDEAMRGFVECSDGRMYHPIIAEKALEGWIEKIAQRKSSAAGNAKRYGQEFDPTSYDGAIDAAVKMLTAINPNSRSAAKRVPKHSGSAPAGTPDPLPLGSQGKGREGKGSNIADICVSETASEEKETQKLFDEVWEGFPKDQTASRGQADAAFALLSMDEKRNFASNIGMIASHIAKMKLPIPYSLAKFIGAKKFEGFLSENKPPTIKTIFVEVDTPEWKSRVAAGHKAGLKTQERIDGRVLEGWRFPVVAAASA